MRFEFKADDLKDVMKHAYDDVELSVTGAMNDVTVGLKTELREQVKGCRPRPAARQHVARQAVP